MSDQMQRIQLKEMKKQKTSRTSEVDTADLSCETELMGEDMMGSMDPDQFRGRGSKSWLNYRQDSSGGGSQDSSEQKEGAPADEGANKQLEGIGPLQKMIAKAVSTDNIEYRSGQMPPGRVIDEKKEEEQKARDAADGKKKQVKLKGLERLDLSPTVHRAESGGKAPEPQEEKKDAPPPKKSEHLSLLAWDDDFIIAEPKAPAAASEEEQELVMDFGSIDVSLDDEETSDLDQIVDDMVITEIPAEMMELLRGALATFGRRVLKVCQDFGSRIAVLKARDTILTLLPPDLCSLEIGKTRAAYVPELKLCVFGEEHLGPGMEQVSVPRLYFAHCFDHALGKDEFASLKSAAVLSNYKACQDREPGHQFTDGFSSLTPVHYFAQAVESFLSTKQAGEALCTGEELYDFDRSMYLYVDYLFSVINKEPGRHFQKKDNPV